MASISKNGAKGHHKFTLTVKETATSVANNTSDISFSFEISPVQKGWNWSVSSKTVSFSININGKTYSGTIPNYDGSSTVVLKSGTQLGVAHNDDGTKTISFSFSVTDGVGADYTCGNASADGKLDLTTIARQANLITASNFNDEQNPTITYSNPAGDSVTALEALISLGYNAEGKLTHDIAYRGVNKTGTLSYTFPLTDAERKILRDAADSNSITVIFVLMTKIGNSTYWSTAERTLSITNANPIITAEVVDTNETTIALTGDSTKLIKFRSDAHATMSVEGQKGAAIDESLYIIRNGINSAYSTSCIFEGVEDNEFRFSAEDSRGNIGSEVLTVPMVDYIELTCNIADNRPDALGNMNVVCSGDYFNNTFGKVSNTLTVQYRYGITGGTPCDWKSMTVTITGDSYTAYADFDIPDFVQTQSYSFETRAIDKLTTIKSGESAVRSLPLYHWGENDFVFEVPVAFNAGVVGATSATSAEDDTYEGSKTITGNLRLKGTGNYGNYLLFGDSNFCYIAELTDDVLTIKASKINLNASGGVYVNEDPIPTLDKGTWTPTLDSSAISSYTTQYGWYSKMGQSVTVGFYIKATCKSGYNSTAISISGLPFTPMYAAAGGGMCSGAYVSGGFNFQCFVAETSKSITTRVQSCNHTSQTNLSTSASGCWYPSGGGEITLSGTITFIANS